MKKRNACALTAAISATFGTMGVADAAVYDAVVTSHLLYSNNSTAGSALNFSSSTATFQYDDVTGLITQTGGVYNVRATTAPTTTLFRHSIEGLVIGNGDPAQATSFLCVEGNFGGNVGASICGNYNFGANFLSDSTTTWGPGTDFGRTIGGDDNALGPQQSILNYNSLDADSFDGTTLVLTNATCTGPCLTLPAGAFNNGLSITFALTPVAEPGANDDTASTRLNTPVTIDALANDEGFADPVTVDITVPPNEGGSVVIENDGVPCAAPCGPAAAGDIRFVLTPSKPANNTVATYTETFSYSVTDGDASGEAQVAVEVANALVNANNGAINIATAGVAPASTSGAINVGTLAGNTLGDAPSVITNSDPALGSVALAGTTLTYTPDANFFAGSDDFTYTITDEDGESDTGTVTVTIPDVAPALANSSVSTDVNDPVDVALLPLATPGNGSPAQHTFFLETDASNGTCDVSGTTLTYTPDADFTGSDSCEVGIADGDGDEDFADISITVNAPPAPGGGTGFRESDGGSSTDLAILSLLGGAALIRRRRRK